MAFAANPPKHYVYTVSFFERFTKDGSSSILLDKSKHALHGALKVANDMKKNLLLNSDFDVNDLADFQDDLFDGIGGHEEINIVHWNFSPETIPFLTIQTVHGKFVTFEVTRMRRGSQKQLVVEQEEKPKKPKAEPKKSKAQEKKATKKKAPLSPKPNSPKPAPKTPPRQVRALMLACKSPDSPDSLDLKPWKASTTAKKKVWSPEEVVFNNSSSRRNVDENYELLQDMCALAMMKMKDEQEDM